MNKLYLYAGVFVALVIPMFSYAAEFRIGEQPAVLSAERVSNDAYIIGGSSTITGTVTGDLFAVGGNVLISGNIGADILVAGGNITIISDVADDVRAGGGNIAIQGKVAGDVLVGGGQVSIGGEGVAGDVIVGAGTLRIDAPVGGNLKVGGGNVYINAPITGNINIEADKVTLGPSAVIIGDMSYKSPKELVKETGAEIRGEVKYAQRASSQPSKAVLAGIFSAWLIGKFLALLISALIIGLVFRRFSKSVITLSHDRPLLEIGRGLLTIIVLPIASVILLVTMLGIPFGVLGLLSLIAITIIACIVAPIILGSFVYGYFSKGDTVVTWKSILLGVVIFELLWFIPILGWLIRALILLLAIGIIVSLKWSVLKEWR